MDVYVLLDVLLIILIALFIPIGFWRGVYREAFVTLGILFGASLGRFWGERWGLELSEVTRLHESGGAFMIAMLCLISATFLLGYSAGAAIPVPEPGWVARALGALIAGANGALLLSFALRDIRVYLLTSEEVGFLDNAIVAPFLSDGTGWILLIAAAVFVPIALVLALFGPDIEEDEYYDTGEFDTYEEADYDPYSQRTLQHGQQMQRPRLIGPVPATHSTPAPAEETRPVPAMHQSSPPHDPAATHQTAQQRDTPPPSSSFGYQPQPQQQAQVTQPHPPPRTQTADAETESGQAPVETVSQRAESAINAQREAETKEPVPEPPPEMPPEAESADTQPREQTDEFHLQTQPGIAQFGTHTVEESTNERQVIFGHRPEPMEHATAQSQQQGARNCPNCQADIRDASGYCPRCGVPI